MKNRNQVSYVAGVKKGQMRLDMPELGLVINLQEKPNLSDKTPIKDLSLDEFKVLKSVEGLKDEEIMVLWEISQKNKKNKHK